MIELDGITKSYPTPLGRRYVFRDLSFRFPDGVSIGLIGPNGAGKSTLLRLLGGIDAPDHGRILTNVRISWPVGLGGGFQPSLTGRDNVRFVSRVYGATGASMRRVIAFVESFAEIGEYFDQPVKMYSSGMRSRLAFGLSMAFDFDYYLIDEVMAVGDARFRQKCQEVFKERLRHSRLILVSHSMRDIVQLCDVVVLVEQGKVRVFEDVKEGVAAYQGDTAAADALAPVPPPLVLPPYIVTKTQATRYMEYLRIEKEAQLAGAAATEPTLSTPADTPTPAGPAEPAAEPATPPAPLPPHVRTRTEAIRYYGYLAAQRESSAADGPSAGHLQESPTPIEFPPYIVTRTQAMRYLGYLAAEAEAEAESNRPASGDIGPAPVPTPAVTSKT